MDELINVQEKKTELTPEQKNKIDDWAEKCYKYKRRWMAYLTKLYGPTFIREFGSPWRMICENVDEIYRYIGHYNRVKLCPAFISVNAYDRKEPTPDRKIKKWKPVYETANLTRLFFDFDGDQKKGLNLEQAHTDALGFYDATSYNHKVELRFSASKGFAVELMNNLTWHENMEIIALAKSKYKTLDRTTNAQQVYRIPYSLHEKSLRQCIPISCDWSLAKILDESQNYRAPPVVI